MSRDVVLTFSEPPPGVNNMYANIPGRGRVLSAKAKAWRELAGHELNLQKPDHVAGTVRITIAIADKGRSDLDGKAKALIDLLVGHGVIEDDNRTIVRDIHLHWDSTITGCRIIVRSIMEQQP